MAPAISFADASCVDSPASDSPAWEMAPPAWTRRAEPWGGLPSLPSDAEPWASPRPWCGDDPASAERGGRLAGFDEEEEEEEAFDDDEDIVPDVGDAPVVEEEDDEFDEEDFDDDFDDDFESYEYEEFQFEGEDAIPEADDDELEEELAGELGVPKPEPGIKKKGAIADDDEEEAESEEDE
jgi:hypothetical protein